MDTSYYAHYLHHKYFEVNYADGMVPLDKWFGSFHDGTPEAHEAMKHRRRKRGIWPGSPKNGTLDKGNPNSDTASGSATSSKT